MQLLDVGIFKKTISAGNITISSGKFIVCAEKFGKSPQTTIIDIADPFNKQRRCPLESAIIHPSGNFIACKTGKSDIQLMILDTKTTDCVKRGSIDEKVLLWKWIDETFIGIVTSRHVYRWELEGDSTPVKVFERLPILSDCKIVNYRENDTICVIAAEYSDRPSGLIQIYNKRTGVSSWTEAEAFAFVNFKLEGNPHPSDILIYSHQEDRSTAKLTLKEINECAFENHQYPEQNFYLPTMHEAEYDFPISIKASSKQEILYMITKQGYLHLFDLHSNTIFFAMRISTNPIITAAGISQRSMVFVDSSGQVSSFSIDTHRMIAFVCQWNPELASNLARRWSKSDEPSAVPTQERLDTFERNSMDSEHFYDSPPSEADSPPSSPSNSHEFRPISLPRTCSVVSRPLPVVLCEESIEVDKSRMEDLIKERDEIADRYQELQRRYRRVLIMMGREVERAANQPLIEKD